MEPSSQQSYDTVVEAGVPIATQRVGAAVDEQYAESRFKGLDAAAFTGPA
jgi:hypothetical protein